MSDDDDLVQRARAGFEELCRALNMDEEASSEAWRTFQNISTNFTLEVRPDRTGPTEPTPGSAHVSVRLRFHCNTVTLTLMLTVSS